MKWVAVSPQTVETKDWMEDAFTPKTLEDVSSQGYGIAYLEFKPGIGPNAPEVQYVGIPRQEKSESNEQGTCSL